MKQGEYIVHRLLPAFVRTAAERQTITFEAFSDDWVLRLQQGERTGWIVGYQFDINAAAASAVASDKVATYVVLHAAGIPAVEHILLRSTPHQALPLEQLRQRFDGPFIIKPLDGSGGREVRIVHSADEAANIVTSSDEIAWAASPVLEIAQEYRVIMLDGKSLATYEKTQPHMHGGLKLFNLGLGAIAVDIDDQSLQAKLSTLASSALSALSLRLASVDIVRLADGSFFILEINDGIMMENYARQSEAYKNRAIQTYDAIVSKMFS